MKTTDRPDDLGDLAAEERLFRTHQREEIRKEKEERELLERALHIVVIEEEEETA